MHPKFCARNWNTLKSTLEAWGGKENIKPKIIIIPPALPK